MKTAKQIMLKALESGNARSLSALTKLTKSTKVSTRISDLRAEGYDIRNTCKHLKNGEVRSTYQLFN
jgi:biotin operon repressor